MKEIIKYKKKNMFYRNMWIAKLKVKSKGHLFGEAGQKFNVKLVGYPLSYQKNGNSIMVKLAGTIVGEKKNITQFLRYLKNKKEIKRISFRENYLICILKLSKENSVLYNPEIIWTKPVIINKSEEIIELASWNKKNILDVIDLLERDNCEILGLRKGNTPSVSITTIMPELTFKQKQAFELAVNKGYYKFPKATNMPKLAKLMNISYSTYQAHLKKAESKIMPYVWY